MEEIGGMSNLLHEEWNPHSLATGVKQPMELGCHVLGWSHTGAAADKDNNKEHQPLLL